MTYKPRLLQLLLGAACLMLPRPGDSQCTKDIDCKGDRICVQGKCVAPPAAASNRQGASLSRQRAASLISEQQRLPRPQTIQINDKYLKRSWSNPVRGFGNVTVCVHQGDKYDDVSERLLYYQAAGLLSIGFETQQGDCPAIYATVTLTDAGRRYAVQGFQVRVWNLAMGAVTGVQLHEQFNVGEVDYLLQVVDVTPFGSNLVTSPASAKASFELFDDGWRIEPGDLQWAPIRVRDMPLTPALEEARRAVAAALATQESRSGSATSAAIGSASRSEPASSERTLQELRGDLEANKDVTLPVKYVSGAVDSPRHAGIYGGLYMADGTLRLGKNVIAFDSSVGASRFVVTPDKILLAEYQPASAARLHLRVAIANKKGKEKPQDFYFFSSGARAAGDIQGRVGGPGAFISCTGCDQSMRTIYELIDSVQRGRLSDPPTGSGGNQN